MKVFNHSYLKTDVAWHLKRAAASCTYSGVGTQEDLAAIERCKAYHSLSGSLMVFTRDVGMHSCGWWKNPEYERCFHLSLSFFDPVTKEQAPKDDKLTDEWLLLFFGERRRMLWCEPPHSPNGKKREVWHYRLFCDAGWQPMIPRGEVYSREFTEAGWKTWSEVNAEKFKHLQPDD